MMAAEQQRCFAAIVMRFYTLILSRAVTSVCRWINLETESFSKLFFIQSFIKTKHMKHYDV